MFQSFFIAFVAFSAYFVYNFVEKFDVNREVPASNDHSFRCEAVRGVRGAEDVVAISDNVFLLSNLDHIVLESTKRKDAADLPSAADPSIADPRRLAQLPGAIYVLVTDDGVDDDDDDGVDDDLVESVRPATIVGRPAGLDFRPHGIGYSAEHNIFAVVTHGYAHGGERVERYRLYHNNEDDTVTLTYIDAVDFTDPLNGAMNDVIPVSPSEFYATQWLWSADPVEGNGIGPMYDLFWSGILPMVLNFRLTHIYYCNVPLPSDDSNNRGGGDVVINHTSVCKIVANPGVMWNGITADPANNLVYAHDLFDRRIYKFSRSTETGDLKFISRADIPQYAGDNIEFNHKTKKIEIGGMAHLKTCFLEWNTELKELVLNEDKVPQGGPSPSGIKCPSVYQVYDPETGKFEVPFIHDGSLLGGFSAAISSGSTIVAGTFGDDGILVCQKKRE